VPTDTFPDERRTHARDFVLRAVVWSLGLFGLVRLSGVERGLVLPLTQMQARIAERAFGLPAQPIEVTLACSGADALALCVGFILAFPASWPRRLAGALGGITLILALNIVRIGTLGRAAASPALFDTLHLYVWPALLMIAIAAYVFTWMHIAGRPRANAVTPRTGTGLPTRFVWVTALLLVLFTAAAPWYLASDRVLTLAAFIARAAAWILRGVGLEATATANILLTARGGFLVTQECVSTPLIPVYLAAVVTAPTTWRRRALALLAAGPLFVGLGIARLLVVALPAALVASPLVLIHAFYQLLLAAVLVGLVALWRHGRTSVAWQRALLGTMAGFGAMYLLSVPYATALTWAFTGSTPLDDPQGALALLPAFQAGLYLGLSVAAFATIPWRAVAAGLAGLLLLQAATFAALDALARHLAFAPQVRDVRAWAVVAPLLLVLALVAYARRRGSARWTEEGAHP
jgi:exosortase/archaeosortase family protein